MAKVLVVRAGTAGAKPARMDERLARHLVTSGRFDYVNPEEGTSMQVRQQVIRRAPKGGRLTRVTKGTRPKGATAAMTAAEGQPDQPEQQPGMGEEQIGNPNERTGEGNPNTPSEQQPSTDPSTEAEPGKYDDMTVDDLKEEVESRELDVTRGDGKDGAPLKADYIAALEADDKAAEK